ncbi:MAG: hypothetical protein SPK05_04535 [Eubacteriales bacterium]|nr:hypothetical protein [Clostridia bacterium]MDY5754517.1 hypothetical protein [Eubacteriales bacterium]
MARFRKLKGVRKLPHRSGLRGALRRSNLAPFLSLFGIIIGILAFAALIMYVLLPAILPRMGLEYNPPFIPTPTLSPTPAPTPTPNPLDVFDPYADAAEIVIDGTEFTWFADPYYSDGKIVFSGGRLVDNDVMHDTIFMFDPVTRDYEKLDYAIKNTHILYPRMNSDWLVFLDSKATGGGQIVAIDRKTEGSEPIVVKDVYVGQPEIKLDGNYLAWTERTGTRMDKLFVCDLTTLETTTLAMFRNSVFGMSIPSLMDGVVAWALSDDASVDDDSAKGLISYIAIDGGSLESLKTNTYVHDPESNGRYFCWLDSNHDENAKLYGTDGKNEPTLIAEGVVEFGLNDDYVVYGKNEVVWLYSFTTEKEYRLTPMDENAQFIGVSNDMVFWYDVSTRGRDVVKYLLIP